MIQEKLQTPFRYPFWKDKVWVWTPLLPIGILCWGMPIAMLFALASPNVPNGVRIFMALILIGVPAYLVGYIFIYSFIEGVFTKVAINDQQISYRTPWVVFPVVLVTKKIALSDIEQIRFMVSYGIGRFAIRVAYRQGKRVCILHLSQFRDSQYIQAMKAVQARVEPATFFPSSPDSIPQLTLSTKDTLLDSRKRRYNLRPRFIDKVWSVLINFSIFAMFGIGGWITSTLPATSKVEVIGVGCGITLVSFGWLFADYCPALSKSRSGSWAIQFFAASCGSSRSPTLTGKHRWL